LNALLLGYYGNRNLGDELMLFALERWLREQDVHVTALSEHPEVTAARTNVPAVLNVPLLGQWNWRQSYLRGSAFRVAAALARADALIVGGGDLIRDESGWRGFSYVIEKIALAHAIGKPVYFVNVGIGVPSSPGRRRVLAWALRRARRIIVRDRRSFELCAALGCARTTVLAPDIAAHVPTLLERAAAGATPPESSPRAEPANAAPYALVSLLGNPNVFGRYPFGDAQTASLAAALDRVVDEAGLAVRFLPFQRAQDGDDNRIHVEVTRRMARSARATIEPETPRIAEALRLFAGARLVVAMRLHAAILGATFAKPCVVLPYDVKCSEFTRSAGIATILTSEQLADPAATLACVRRALREDVRSSLREEARVWDSLSLDTRRDRAKPAESNTAGR